MKFLQKRAVAVTLTVLMVALSLAVGFGRAGTAATSGNSAAEQSEKYERYIRDEAGLLDNELIDEISQRNAASDEAFGSVCALVTLDELPGDEREKLADQWFDRMELGEMDCILLFSVEDGMWQFWFGADLGWYADSALEDIVYRASERIVSDPSVGLPVLYADLAGWYGSTLPSQQYASSGTQAGSFIGTAAIVVFIVVLIFVLSAAGTVRRVVRGPRIFFGGPTIIHRTHFHRPPPPPGPHFRPGGPSRPMSGGPRGGFGGSRPSGGSRGGFGGSGRSGSRGGFGGRR